MQIIHLTLAYTVCVFVLSQRENCGNKKEAMEQYTTATTTTGEQIVVQTANGQIQQQVSGQVTHVIFIKKSMSYHPWSKCTTI